MTAQSACLPCSSRKKKCDKALPTCGRCERLLLKCNYRDTAPSSTASVSRYYVESAEKRLNEELTHLQVGHDSELFISSLSAIIATHRQLLDRIADSFLLSCQRWMPVFHQEDSVTQQPRSIMSRDSMVFLLSMCMITRPLINDHGQLDALRESMYRTVKRLFCDPATIEKPTIATIKAGLLLSVYEYGHGLLNPSFMTVSTCSSMAQVTRLGGVEYDCQSLPPFGSHPVEENAIKLWWSIKIHERMISLKTGLTIRPLLINETDIMDNRRLETELQHVNPQLAFDKHHVSFHLQARAAIWLDMVLHLVRSPIVTFPEGRLRFRAVDQGLLHFLTILLDLGMGTCCEAISITLNTFIHLHKSRLEITSPFLFTEQDKIISSKAIKTMLRVLSDFFDNFKRNNPHIDIHNTTNLSHEMDSGIFTDTFPYFIHMIYVLLREMQERRYIPQSPSRMHTIERESSSTFEREIDDLRALLQYTTKRWQISREYIYLLDSSAT